MLELAYVWRVSVSKMEQIYGRCDLAIASVSISSLPLRHSTGSGEQLHEFGFKHSRRCKRIYCKVKFQESLLGLS